MISDDQSGDSIRDDSCRGDARKCRGISGEAGVDVGIVEAAPLC